MRFYILAEKGDERGFLPPATIVVAQRPKLVIEPAALAALLPDGATIVDLSPGRNFRKGHIAGA